MVQREFTEVQITKIASLLAIKKLSELKKYFQEIPSGLIGVEELEFVFQNSSTSNLIFDITLARGLNYYTGVIWEIKSLDTQMGSIGSGGRYANLTEMFGGRNMSGVGISFGVERIYDIMEELNLFPENIAQSTKLLFAHFNERNKEYAFKLLQQCRAAGIAAEIYPDLSKIDKQFKYANAKGIPYVAVIGDNEMNAGQVNLKDMQSGEQRLLNTKDLIEALK